MINHREYETLKLVANGISLLGCLEARSTHKHKIRSRVEALERSGLLRIKRLVVPTKNDESITYSEIEVTPKGTAAISEVDAFYERVRGTK